MEWKIYRKDGIDRIGNGDPFSYWTLSITSDYRYFFFSYGNTDLGPGCFEYNFIHGSRLPVSRVTEEGEYSLANFVASVLENYRENRYCLT